MYRDWSMAEAEIGLAGLVFEKLLRPHHSYTYLCLFGPPASDYKTAMEWCRYFFASDDDTQVERFLFKYLLPPVHKLLRENWNEIAAVGDLLLQRGQLSQAEVEAIINANGCGSSLQSGFAQVQG